MSVSAAKQLQYSTNIVYKPCALKGKNLPQVLLIYQNAEFMDVIFCNYLFYQYLELKVQKRAQKKV